MDSDTMLGIHMFGDVQAYVSDDILMAETLLAESRGIYGFNRELTGTDAYADLITLIENHYGDWAYRILDRYTVQALWSLADEYGAHNALEFIESQNDSAETL